MKRIIITLIALELLTRFVVGDVAWYADDIVDSVQVIALCWVLAKFVQRQIAAWCLLVAYGTCETVEMLSNAAWYCFDLYNPVLDEVRVAVAVVALMYYRYRRYDYSTVSNPSDDYIYVVHHKPRCRQDRILAMFGKPFGGVGVYCRGEWYHFSKGQFIVSYMQPTDSHVMLRAQRYNPNVITRLREMVGTQWTLRKNCITMITPLIRR